MLKNHFVSVLVDGQLDAWTGPNPEKNRASKKLAVQRAETLRREGHTAYAVEVIEILPEDVGKKGV